MRRVLIWLVAVVGLSAGGHTAMQAYRPQPVADLTPSGLTPPGDPQPRVVAPTGGGSPTAATGPRVDPAWLVRTARRTGVPARALRAYARAELMADDDCGVGWTTLAGIGWVESQHGTIGGRSLGADGRSSSPVLGPALDGRGPVAAIPATARSSAWHGDASWDHAVGQMQFIPSTWDVWGSDGDGDATADPNDIDDAAHSAARYLCADGRDLRSGEGWTAGVLSYNHSSAYLADVHAAATAYADRAGG